VHEQIPRPPRLFLDSGVVIAGTYTRWGSSKGVLILTALRANFRAVIADPVHEEIARNMRKLTSRLADPEARTIMTALEDWYKIARPLRLPRPSDDELQAHADLLAVVRHHNDMPAVVAAVLFRPDWVLSTNTEHWNADLAQRTGLRIAHPAEFLQILHA